MSYGIDIAIDRLVSDFNSELWTSNNNSFYGRVFRNERFVDFQSKISPEVYISEQEPAREVLKDDRFDAQCFFDVQPEDDISGDIHTSEVWICFMVNFLAIYPTFSRTDATEQLHRDVENLIGRSEFEMIGLIRGFTGFTDYDWGDENTQAKVDLQKNYMFRFNTRILYANC